MGTTGPRDAEWGRMRGAELSARGRQSAGGKPQQVPRGSGARRGRGGGPAATSCPERRSWALRAPLRGGAGGPGEKRADNAEGRGGAHSTARRARAARGRVLFFWSGGGGSLQSGRAGGAGDCAARGRGRGLRGCAPPHLPPPPPVPAVKGWGGGGRADTWDRRRGKKCNSPGRSGESVGGRRTHPQRSAWPLPSTARPRGGRRRGAARGCLSVPSLPPVPPARRARAARRGGGVLRRSVNNNRALRSAPLGAPHAAPRRAPAPRPPPPRPAQSRAAARSGRAGGGPRHPRGGRCCYFLLLSVSDVTSTCWVNKARCRGKMGGWGGEGIIIIIIMRAGWGLRSSDAITCGAKGRGRPHGEDDAGAQRCACFARRQAQGSAASSGPQQLFVPPTLPSIRTLRSPGTLRGWLKGGEGPGGG